MSNKTISMNVPLYDRDLSWLSFNYRVLCMAKDESVPLYERTRFLSIFSSNLDEFVRVRMPAILAVNKVLDNNPAAAGEEIISQDTLPAIQAEINRQLGVFGQTLTGYLLPALHGYNIHLYYNEPVREQHLEHLREYFLTRVLSFLQPLWLRKKKPEEVFLENNQLYFVGSAAICPGKYTQYVPATLYRTACSRQCILHCHAG
jgi:polyphosphate kinase